MIWKEFPHTFQETLSLDQQSSKSHFLKVMFMRYSLIDFLKLEVLRASKHIFQLTSLLILKPPLIHPYVSKESQSMIRSTLQKDSTYELLPHQALPDINLSKTNQQSLLFTLKVKHLRICITGNIILKNLLYHYTKTQCIFNGILHI